MTTLIMSENRPQQIADGEKTLTNRPVKEGDTFREANETLKLPDAVIDRNGRCRWKVGAIEGIKPQRIAPVCLVDNDDNHVMTLDDMGECFFMHTDKVVPDTMSPKELRDWVLVRYPNTCLLQVRVLELKSFDVREMTDEDAICAGFADSYSYLKWWTRTYDRHAWREEQKFYALDYGTLEHVDGWCAWLREARPAKKYEAWFIRFERNVFDAAQA